MKIKLYPSQYGGLALRKMAGALTYCQNPRLTESLGASRCVSSWLQFH